MILGGLFLLVVGAEWLVDSASRLARSLGVSDAVIALTLVSAGTSLPELATSIVAALRGERDIAVGNVVGSNIFNILGVMGVSSAVSPTGVALPETMLSFDIPVMVASAVACLPVFLSGGRIARWEGAVFLVVYVGYIIALLQGDVLFPGLHTLRMSLMLFVVPLSAITFFAAGSNWKKA